MRGARSIVFLEVDLSAKAPDGRLSNRAECRCFASGREAHSSAASTFGRASPSAVAEQANSALEPTALRAAAPPVVADHRSAPVNALGYLRVMFAVEDIDDTLARLRKRGAKLVGEVVQYEDKYRLCYIRGPEGILIGLAQQLNQQTSRANPM